MNPPPRLRSLVLSASAGTGKTFRLSNRYLRLVREGAAVDGILASTFTRMAAAEILDAILGRLAEACDDDAKRGELAGFLRVDGEWSLDDATELLCRLLRDLPHLQVSTLDSWFQQQVGAASLELGLPWGWRLAETLDVEEMHREAVENTVVDLPHGQALELLAAMHAGKPKRSLLDKVEDELRSAAGLWEACQGREEAWELLGHVRDPSIEERDVAYAVIADYELPRTAGGSVDKTWDKARNAILLAIEEDRWKDVAQNGLCAKILAGETTFGRHAIDRDALRPLVDTAARVLLVHLHRATCALRDLARRYADTRQQLQENSGLLGYDDFPRRLASCTAEQRSLFARRLGRRAKHLLLDEFQDTSVGQWLALQGPVEDTLSAEAEERGSLFVVGDFKQSIYGFREGEPRLLEGIAAWYGLPKADMAKNFRSSAVILDAVNRTFEGMAERFGHVDSKVLELALGSWQEFPRHEAGKDLPGEVRVVEVQGKRANVAQDNEAAILDRVESLVRRFPDRSVGVLVKKNQTVANLLANLGQRGIPACGAGGNPLTDAQAVDQALSLFQLADHPGDTAAYFHVATSPLAGYFEVEFVAGKQVHAHARLLSRRVRERLLREGYGGFLDGLHGFLGKTRAYDGWNRKRFAQLVALGRRWDQRMDLRPARFADWIRKESVATQDAGQVQVMTVHKSKGLAFDTVVLLVDSSHHKRGTVCAGRPDPRGPVTGIGGHPTDLHVSAARHLECHEYLDAFRAQEARDLHESLCVLYVGMTRARLHMELVLPKPAKSSVVKPDWFRSSEVVSTMLVGSGSLADLPDETTSTKWVVRWQTAELEGEVDADATATGADAPVAANPSAEVPPPFFAPSRGERSLPRWTPSSGGKVEGKITGNSLFADTSGTARRRGTALHRLFEEVEWLEDHAVDPERDRRHLRELEPPPSPQEMELWLEDFARCLKLEGVRRPLSRPTDLEKGVELEVLRERPFAVRTTDPHGATAILQGIYDRVVLQRRDGVVVAADVLDFKTGAPAEDGGMPEEYRGQLDAYRRALCVQFGLDAQAVHCRLLFVDEGVECVLRTRSS